MNPDAMKFQQGKEQVLLGANGMGGLMCWWYVSGRTGERWWRVS